ncbi:MAG: LysM peptidoglycan-binding domain-containing protein, partial [Anaerolineae bacterium]|nr:LysM peptidoglycan-binding domain-containing protein [Anaerolineae bacterium]
MAAVALAAAGSILIYLGLVSTEKRSPSIIPVVRGTRIAASARGNSLGERARGAGFEVARVVWPGATDAPSQVIVAAMVTPTPQEASEAPSAIPTVTVLPSPTAAPPRTEVIVYLVQPGDNLWLIAQRFGLSQDTLVWANPGLERHPDELRIGQELNVPPVDGVLHTVMAGETLAAIARRYGVEAEQIMAYAPNGITD